MQMNLNKYEHRTTLKNLKNQAKWETSKISKTLKLNKKKYKVSTGW